MELEVRHLPMVCAIADFGSVNACWGRGLPARVGGLATSAAPKPATPVSPAVHTTTAALYQCGLTTMWWVCAGCGVTGALFAIRLGRAHSA